MLRTNRTSLTILAALAVAAYSSAASAAFIAYTADYDGNTGTTVFVNSASSGASLRTFSLELATHTLGGAYNPIYVAPGGMITYHADGTYELTGAGAGGPVPIANGKVNPNTKTWNGVTDPSTTSGQGWQKWDPGTQTWSGTSTSDTTAKNCNFYYLTPGTPTMTFTDSDPAYTFEAKGGAKGTWFHVGPLPGGLTIPPPPNPNLPPKPDTKPAKALFASNQPQLFVLGGHVGVPTTDSTNFFSVSTPYAAAGCVPEPSTLALAGLGAVGLIGVIRRRKRA